MGVQSSGKVEFKFPINTVFHTIVDAAGKNQLTPYALDGADESAGRVALTSGASFSSWGEKIVIQLTDNGNGTTSAVITSASRVKTTLVDYGRNSRNVRKIATEIAQALNEQLSSGAQGAPVYIPDGASSQSSSVLKWVFISIGIAVGIIATFAIIAALTA